MATEADVVEDDALIDVDPEVDATADTDGKTNETGRTVEDEPKPGTPDKALQKMQQELGNVTRQLAALTEKKQADGGLSEADKAKLEKAQQRIAKIRQFAGRPERDDLPSDVDPIADHVLDLTEKLSEQDKLKAELEETRERLEKLESVHTWDVVKARYPDLDTDAIWDKASKDAVATLGEDTDPKAINRLASRWFEERCEAAKKRVKGDAKKDDGESTPSTYRVGSGQRTAPILSEEQETLAEARGLVREI